MNLLICDRVRHMVLIRLIFIGILIIIVVLLLLEERFKLKKYRKQIPLRICVTGTRGKSSVTRLIAGSLREAGIRVLAKTTGSKPMLVYPDGTESLIKRRGKPNILETKNIITRAARLGIDVLVTELMSIQPECMYSESVQMLDPSLLVVTNIRPDHQEQWGYSKTSLYRTFIRALPKRCALFLPEEESAFFSVKPSDHPGLELKFIPQDLPEELTDRIHQVMPLEFDQNIKLALAVAEYLGVEKEVALKGMAKALPDFGSLRAWESIPADSGKKYISVSAFAANDPQSTQMVINKIIDSGLKNGKKLVGILNLREDRADRTLQWLREFRLGHIQGIDRLVLTGGHAAVFKRKLKSLGALEIEMVKEQDPELFIRRILSRDKEGRSVLLGMGNMLGMGSVLVKYWEENGVGYDF
ncbi:MAG: poly-gamma-glutamate synthase PgsB [Candidatus Aminicenantes bacterium]|nr:poly-gamma-glutamate synthase PgsB [Candidatus Aminicenantes bacterium]